MSNNAPIGVYDSGIGGLSVLNEIRKQLPQESVIYYGDTKHLPYGEKSPEDILAFNVNIFTTLVKCGCKIVVSACNTSSAIALDTISTLFPDLPIVSLIQPGASSAYKASRNGRVGVIATTRTIDSGAYAKALHQLDSALNVQQVACPEFVPLVESGKLDTPQALAIVQKYVSQFKDIDTLIYGCTHYPALEAILSKIYPGKSVSFIDPAISTVAKAKTILKQKKLNAELGNNPKFEFIWSGAVPSQFEEKIYTKLEQLA